MGWVVFNVFYDCFCLGVICFYVFYFDMCIGCEEIVYVDFYWCVFGDIGVFIFEVEFVVYFIWLNFMVIDGVCIIWGIGIV